MSISVMKKLTAYAYSSDADLLVQKLMKLKCVDIGKNGISDAFDDDLTSFSGFDTAKSTLEHDLQKIDRAHEIVNKYSQRKKSLFRPKIEIDKDEFISNGKFDATFKTVDTILELTQKISDFINEQNSLNSLIDSLQPWKNCDVPLNFSGTKTTKWIVGTFQDPSRIDEISTLIEDSGGFMEIQDRDKSTAFVSVIYPFDCEDELNKIFASAGFNKLNFKNVDSTASVAISKSQSTLVKLDASIIKTEDKLKDLAKFLDDIEILRDIENYKLEVVKQKLKLYQSGSCVVLNGWVPLKAKERVVSELDKLDCAYELNDPAPDDDPPVLLENNGFSSTFEWVIGMYSYPKYGRFDPTFIMSLFYFIIFGLMFADVGYGLILVVACFGGVRLLKPQDSMKRMMLMFGYCGISSIIMGAIFGGWFGDLPFAIMTNLLGMENAKQIVPFFNGMWFNPLDDPMGFLMISLGVGVIHLVAGMAIQFYMLCKDGKVIDAFCDIFSWWVLFAGIGVIFVQKTVGTVLLIAGVLMLVLTQGRHEKNIAMKLIKGVGSLYNSINYVSDLLSYSRILALGLVAGVIAQVINIITMLGSSVVGFIAMILILIFGHILNLAINVLGTFVHTSRLQYIEFFGKFYEDGGREFVPASSDNKYTTDK